jgi:hypothetical protein
MEISVKFLLKISNHKIVNSICMSKTEGDKNTPSVFYFVLFNSLPYYNKQMELLEVQKKKFINMLAVEKIKHDEYLEMVEDNNNEIAQLSEKKLKCF